MVSGTILVSGAIVALASRVSAHASIFTEAMWGFNKTDTNRPQDPLIDLPFSEWWFHGHLDYPPHPEDIEQLPVGGSHNFPISCDKDATIYWESGPGGNQQDANDPDNPCPGRPSTAFHANNISDTAGCALAVAYKSDVSDVKQEDFVIFSVNHTCVWYLNTAFDIPADMPACPDGKCICAWFWIHNIDSGSEQMYMTGFQCNFTGATSTTPLPPPQLARRCGYDKFWDTPADPANCTHGPKSPLYWYQAEGNYYFEDTYHAPVYNELYNFVDGAQNDIFWPNGDPNNQTYNTSSTIPSDTSTTSPVPSGDPLVSSSAPPPSTSLSTSSSYYPPASPPSPSPSSPSADNVDLAGTPSSSPSPSDGNVDPSGSSDSYPPQSSSHSSPCHSPSPNPTLTTDPESTSLPSSDSYPPQSSSQPSPYPSSAPNPTLTTDPESTSLPSSDSYPPQSSSQPSPYPSSSPNPTLTTDPESTSLPKSSGKCRPRSKSSSSSAYSYNSEPSSSSSDIPSPSPSQNNVRRAKHRRVSSLEDKQAARRVWGHRGGNA